MRILTALILCLALFGPFQAVHAQDPSPLRIEPAGEAYLRAIRFRGINSDVGYFDPTAPAPPIDTSQQPRQPSEQDPAEAARAVSNIPFELIAAAVILALLFMFFRYGGAITLSARSEAENSRRMEAGELDGKVITAEEPLSLSRILAIKDRRQALVQLARNALGQTIRSHGVLLQRSWTSRDALRRVPLTQDRFAALRDLVMDSERVQFGGRDVSEEEFRAHVEQVRPLLVKGMP